VSAATALSPSCGPTAARKGRPRDERVDEHITSAALGLLAEVGFERFSVEEVAARAGVAKSTVYRRFPTRDDLVAGTLQRLNDELPPAPPPGPVRGRLQQLMEEVRLQTPHSVRGRILMHAGVEGRCDPDLAVLVQQRVLAPRREMVRDIIRDGIASGELRDDIDLDAVVPVLVGPMIYLGAWGAALVPCVSTDAVIETVLAGLR
jgi:AcrR family transcriptional regulator